MISAKLLCWTKHFKFINSEKICEFLLHQTDKNQHRLYVMNIDHNSLGAWTLASQNVHYGDVEGGLLTTWYFKRFQCLFVFFNHVKVYFSHLNFVTRHDRLRKRGHSTSAAPSPIEKMLKHISKFTCSFANCL